MTVERIQILIDGGNFHHLALKKLGVQELDFDFECFIKFLANGRAITENGKRVYISRVSENERRIKKQHTPAPPAPVISPPRINRFVGAQPACLLFFPPSLFSNTAYINPFSVLSY